MIPFWRRDWVWTGEKKFFAEKVATDSDGGEWRWERLHFGEIDLDSGERRWKRAGSRRLVRPDGHVEEFHRGGFQDSYC